MISITTPASKTPIIRIIKLEKLPMVSVVVDAMEAVKLSGNAINVSIIGEARRNWRCFPYMVKFLSGSYFFGKKLTKLRAIKKAMPMPNRMIIIGILPVITAAVVEEISETIVLGICIAHFIYLSGLDQLFF